MWNVEGDTEATALLQEPRCLQDSVGHGEGHWVANCPRQTSARLGKRDQVCKSVKDPGPYKDPEVQQGRGQLRAAQSVQQSNANKRDNVFQVIQVASGERSKVIWKCYILLNKPPHASLFFSTFRACYYSATLGFLCRGDLIQLLKWFWPVHLTSLWSLLLHPTFSSFWSSVWKVLVFPQDLGNTKELHEVAECTWVCKNAKPGKKRGSCFLGATLNKHQLTGGLWLKLLHFMA